MWSACSDSSLFDGNFDLKKHKKNHKYLIYETEMKMQEKWNEIWKFVGHDDIKKHILADLQPAIVECKNKISNKIHEFLKVKRELQDECNKIENLINNEILSKFLPSEVAKTVLWLETVNIAKYINNG